MKSPTLTSRWEVFGISIAEAMYLGVPCAIAETIYLAQLFKQYNLGLVLPSNPEQAALRLSEAIAQPDRLQHWSREAQVYAKSFFSPKKVTLDYLHLYEEMLNSNS